MIASIKTRFAPSHEDYDEKEHKYLADRRKALKNEVQSIEAALILPPEIPALVLIPPIVATSDEDWSINPDFALSPIPKQHHRTHSRIYLPTLEETAFNLSPLNVGSPTAIHCSILNDAVKDFLLDEYTVGSYCSEEEDAFLERQFLFSVDE